MTAGIEAEIIGLHDWFEAWFDGAAPPETISRLEAALDPGFRMVDPGGRTLDRADVITAISAGRARGGHGITIRDIRVMHTFGDVVVAEYEEWQDGIAGRRGRRSSAVLEWAGGTWRWHHVHETWLPER